MPVIDTIADTWASVGPLTTPEVWQCKAGAVVVTTETPGGSPHALLGVLLQAGEVYPGPIPIGKAVSYRRVSGAPAAIHREAV